jgi:hypothetical protein
MNVSYYGSISEPKIKDAELKKILDSIQTGHWKKPIEEIRNCLLMGETVKASKLHPCLLPNTEVCKNIS